MYRDAEEQKKSIEHCSASGLRQSVINERSEVQLNPYDLNIIPPSNW